MEGEKDDAVEKTESAYRNSEFSDPKTQKMVRKRLSNVAAAFISYLADIMSGARTSLRW